jgi:sterol desaturase/sphingolipid hydroxylase (fatty acid hydroxylase superfamily)
MNTTRRKFVLRFCIFLGLMAAGATGVLAYAAHQMQLARFGDIFDRVVSEQTQTWVLPVLIVIAGVSIIGLLLFVGLFIFRSRETEHV